MDNYEIFISYRREGGQEYARPLQLELEKRGYRVFLDFDALTDGKFDKRIMDAIDAAPVFISILSPHCFDRCVNPNDWVRKEIEYAFDHEKHIIPVNIEKLFKQFPNDTPAKLREAIGQHQMSEVMMGSLFQKSMDKMIEDRIAPILGGRNGRSYEQPTETRGSLTSVLKVETDLDCQIFVDGKDRGVAKRGDITYVDLRSGTYRLRFVAKDDPDVVIEEKRFRIDRDTEEWYSVELMALKKAAEEKREEERIKQAESWYDTGKKYYDQKNYPEAFLWFKKAAEKGYAKAQYDLGWCYERGEGTATDEAQAFSWFKKAAEQGYVHAQFSLAECFEYGMGTVTNKEQAIYWYKKFAKQGGTMRLEAIIRLSKLGILLN